MVCYYGNKLKNGLLAKGMLMSAILFQEYSPRYDSALGDNEYGQEAGKGLF